MPDNKVEFVRRVFKALGGQPRDESLVTSKEEQQAQWERNNRHSAITDLAQQSLTYVQIREAVGRPLELKDFGAGKFKYRAQALADDVDAAWSIYSRVVEATLEGADYQGANGSASAVEGHVGRSGVTSSQ